MLREIVVLLSVVSLVNCDQSCWQCSDTASLATCRGNIVTCPANEKCFLEKVTTDTLQVRYSAGCRSDAACSIMASLNSAPGKRVLLNCAQCCTGPHCQDNLCGATPSAGISTMTCLSCSLATSPGACQHYEVCQDTEVCYAGMSIVGSLLRYSFGCRERHLCKTLAENEVAGHPGRDIGTGVQICDACCVGDQCNNADCYVLKKNMTVAMFSTR